MTTPLRPEKPKGKYHMTVFHTTTLGGLVSFVTIPSLYDIFNILPPEENGNFLADNILKCNFLNENLCNLIQISMKFVPGGPTDNKSVLLQLMSWH